MAQASTSLSMFCDTVVPRADARGVEDDEERSFLGRAASDLDIAGMVDPTDAAAALAALGPDFEELDPPARTTRIRGVVDGGGDAAHAVRSLRGQVLALFYGVPDEGGTNINWRAIGYPGPASAPPTPEQAPKTIAVRAISRPTVLDADACVVGSGAGGAVIAARLQRAGLKVVILEQGDYRNESDFRQLELDGARDLYLGGGIVWSETGSLGILAGSTLGGGTVVNSLVCLRTPDHVRARWAADGLEGADGPEFDECLDAVWERLGVNTAGTVPNTSNLLMTEALERCGRSWELLPRNAAEHDDPRFCGYCNAGCQQGAKNSVLKNYLLDASVAGADVIVRCRANRILVEDGRAAGVEAVVTDQAGAEIHVTIRSPRVVVAGGGIESPALLLRSGIGGPAVGQHLRVHPAWFVTGLYADRIDAWSGQIQSVVSFDYAHLEHGDGFLCECVILSPTFWAASMPWESGADHKRAMLDLRRAATWHGVAHDHGSGRVTIAADGTARVEWELDNELDRLTATAALTELSRLHEAAGAEEIYTFQPPGLRWRRGDDFESFLGALGTHSPRVAYSAHQMGSCRMGIDARTSVANVEGELHDVAGVWIGDASALPSAPGVNPMITIMAVAERTARRIVGATS